MGRERRLVGFWASLRHVGWRGLWTWEFAGGAVVAILGGGSLLPVTNAASRHDIAGDYLSLTSALLGVVFAALALVAALMTDSYLAMLAQTSGGVLAFLRPFMVVIGVQVGAVLGVVGYRAFGERLVNEAEIAWFVGVTILFTVSTLEVVALTRSVLLHGVARAKLVEAVNPTAGVHSGSKPRRK